MIARATGAFLLSLFVIGYLLGSFDGGLDLLLALLVSLLVGVAVALWLERERREPPDVFDEKATRRAVRRGVIRTALTSVLWICAGFLVVNVATAILLTRGDRRDHFDLVAGYGFAAAHPELRVQLPVCCSTVGLRSLELRVHVEPRTADPVAVSTALELRLDLRGRLNFDWRREVPASSFGGIAAVSAREKEAMRRQLDALPPVVATAIAELTQPLSPPDFYALLARHGLAYPGDDVPVYLQLDRGSRHEGELLERRVGWPSPALAQFQSWVKRLRKDDDELLDELGLPGSESLRRLATNPRIHGFILEKVRPATLRSLLNDTAIRSVSVGEIAFALEVSS